MMARSDCAIGWTTRASPSRKRRGDLDADRKLNLSLVRLLEIIGEAPSRTTADERARYPQIPWAQIVGLRNRLIHGYDSVDFDILWQIVTHDLTALISVLQPLVAPESE